MKHATITLLFVLALSALAGPLEYKYSAAADHTRTQIQAIKANAVDLFPVKHVLLSEEMLFSCKEKPRTTDPLKANDMLKQSGIRFQENRGQIVDTDGKVRNDIAFIANAPGARLYFRNDGISTVFMKTVRTRTIDLPLEGIGPENVSPWGEMRGDNRRVENQTYRLDMKLVGSNPFARVRAHDELPGYVNYYLAHCPGGITGVKEYSRIVYEHVYENIDLEILSIDGRMKYNFVVRPGGNVSDIKMKYDGATETAVMNDGALAVATPLGRIEEATPYTYAGDESNEVSSRFLRKGNTVSFAVDEYDQTQTLVIDPWATYYGGSGSDQAKGITVDGSGNVIISGITTSLNFPVTTGAQQTTIAGGADAFVAKFDGNGTRLWSTYYGGSGNESETRVVTDATGNIVFAGYTLSTNLPVTAGAFQTTNAGYEDMFVVKFNDSGSRLWATYYGGSKTEYFFGGIAIDPSGNVLLSGGTNSQNFPVTAGAFQTALAKPSDAFVLKLSASGSRLWATYFGGKNAGELSWGITSDSNGNVFFISDAFANFPVTSGAFQMNNAGGEDFGIVKLSSSGSRVWATYYGGSGNDYAKGISTDGNGNVVLTGYTWSTNFPITGGSFQTTYGGGSYDAFIVKFTGTGSRSWATYYGGSGSDNSWDVYVDATSSIIISGYTNSSNFPVSANALQSSNTGGSDACVVKLSSTGSRTWATYYGGSTDDFGRAVTGDQNGNVIFSGATTSSNIPLYGFPYQSSFAGGDYDAFVVSLNQNGLFTKRVMTAEQIPSAITFDQNFPNPFNPTTTISFSIPEEMNVRLTIYDALGTEVAELVNNMLTVGSYSILWSAGNISSGSFIAHLVARDESGHETILRRQMTLVK